MTKPTLHWLPLELIDKRYTAQTRRWYKKEFEKQFKLNIIEGYNNTQTINNGSFLDVYGTNYYKASQLMKVAEIFKDKVKDGDIFFIDDLWFPGIQMIRYMAQMATPKKIKIYGVMHAGSWVPSDDVATKLGYNNETWSNELSMILTADKVFVGSNFHKREMEKYFGNKVKDKIIATGIPFYPSDILKYVRICKWKDKGNIIVFPHRNHKEKHPELFDKLRDKFRHSHPEWIFVKTFDMGLEKEAYYKLLAESKVMISYAEQENFGFATLESATFGNMLLLPNRVVYPEIYPKETVYCSEEQLEIQLKNIIDNPDKEPKIVKRLKKIPYQFEKSIKNMIKEMK